MRLAGADDLGNDDEDALEFGLGWIVHQWGSPENARASICWPSVINRKRQRQMARAKPVGTRLDIVLVRKLKFSMLRLRRLNLNGSLVERLCNGVLCLIVIPMRLLSCCVNR